MPLSTADIRARLRGSLPTWFDTRDAIQRKFRFGTFNESILFVSKIAEAAEKKRQRPSMCISYNTVGVVLTTNDVSGVTEDDLNLLRRSTKSHAPSQVIRQGSPAGRFGSKPLRSLVFRLNGFGISRYYYLVVGLVTCLTKRKGLVCLGRRMASEWWPA